MPLLYLSLYLMNFYIIKYLGSQFETTLDKTIIVANCVTENNDALIIFAGGLDATGSPVVEYGNVATTERDWRVAPTSRLSGGIWHKNTVWNGRSGDVVVTFGTNITRRYCIVYAITNGGRFDLVKRNVQDTEATQARTLTSAVLSTTNEQAFAFHLSLGPITDTVGTLDTGWNSLHRIGTSLGSDDMTIQTAEQSFESAAAISSTLTVTTARQWLSALIAIRPTVLAPALDSEGSEIFVGDTVRFESVNSIVSSLIQEQGIPAVVLVLEDGRQLLSYYTLLVE